MSSAEKQLREILNSLVEEKFGYASDVKIKSISSDGANNTSSLFEVQIISAEENINIFAKVASMGTLQTVAKTVFDKEKYFYSKLASAYEEIQDKYEVEERLTIPKYYRNNATDEALVILIENLASKGYDCHDRLKCVNWKYASRSVEALAKFHALSLALRKESPGEFKKAVEALTSKTLTGSEWNGLADGALAALEESDRKILSRLLEGSVGWSIVKDFGDPINTPVIIHRDYRVSNLMHKEVKLPLGLCVAAVMLPFVTVDPAHAPTYEHGRFVPRPNELFAERFRGLFEDFKQWGYI